MRQGRVLIIAHRGASAEAPENTAAAIRRALALGADMVELDVQLTKDRRLVIFHDARLERTTTGRGPLAQRTYRDIARLDCGSWFFPRFAGERILLVSQALRLIPPPRQANLELKATSRRAVFVRRLIRSLAWTRTITRVLVSSFDPWLLAQVKARQPRIATALLCHRQPDRTLRQAVRIRCAAFHPHTSLINPSLIARAHAAGLRVHAWTVDRPPEARRLVRMGVDGLFTNVPARIRPAARRFPSGSSVGASR